MKIYIIPSDNGVIHAKSDTGENIDPIFIIYLIGIRQRLFKESQLETLEVPGDIVARETNVRYFYEVDDGPFSVWNKPK